MKSVAITGGLVLTRDAGFVETGLCFDDGAIRFGEVPLGANTLDASGWMVLPGIVDIHGDAFERQLQPRPGVEFPTLLAVRDTEAQLLSNGITTAFLGVTLSWEPGLRSAQSWRAILDALASRTWVADIRIHLRWEAFNLDALDMAIEDIAAGRVHLLAFNDHTPAILRRLEDPVTAAKYSERAAMQPEQFRAIAARISAFAPEVPAAQQRIARAARVAGVAMASHDDATIDDRRHFRELGARICEFPMAESVGAEASAAHDAVVMGSPNVVRGGSHLGWASAAPLAEAGICSILSSDYFYPALLHASFILADRGILDFSQAWSLIAKNPARASGLNDRGALAEGLRGDVIVVDPQTRTVQATIIQGRIAYLTGAGAERLRWP